VTVVIVSVISGGGWGSKDGGKSDGGDLDSDDGDND